MYSDKKDDIEEDFEEEETSSDNSIKGKLNDFYQSNKKLVLIVGGIIVFLLLISMFNGCSNGNNSNNNNNNDNKAIELVLDTTKEEISVGNSIKLIATVTNVSDATFEWYSTNNNVAKVDSQGNVTGVGIGSAIISVSYKKDGKTYSGKCDILVTEGDKNITPTNISFPDGELLITKGYKYQLIKQIEPSNAYVTNISYKSSNPSIVKVDNDGNIETLNIGMI